MSENKISNSFLKGQNMKKGKLTKKELLFCHYFALCANAREAASKSGYASPERAGMKLMAKKEIREEIKKPKGGGLEIKFFDRLKALEKLSAICENGDESSSMPFYEAIRKSAKALDGKHNE